MKTWYLDAKIPKQRGMNTSLCIPIEENLSPNPRVVEIDDLQCYHNALEQKLTQTIDELMDIRIKEKMDDALKNYFVLKIS